MVSVAFRHAGKRGGTGQTWCMALPPTEFVIKENRLPQGKKNLNRTQEADFWNKRLKETEKTNGVRLSVFSSFAR